MKPMDFVREYAPIDLDEAARTQFVGDFQATLDLVTSTARREALEEAEQVLERVLQDSKLATRDLLSALNQIRDIERIGGVTGTVTASKSPHERTHH